MQVDEDLFEASGYLGMSPETLEDTITLATRLRLQTPSRRRRSGCRGSSI
jgi:hypothetical protein